MKYALDSNIMSYILRGNQAVLLRLKSEEMKGNSVAIPLMVYYEVTRGLKAANATTKMKMFESYFGSLRIVDMNVADMRVASDIYAYRKRRGAMMDDGDLLIAAQCVSRGYILVTHNTRHFEGISGLSTTDWIE